MSRIHDFEIAKHMRKQGVKEKIIYHSETDEGELRVYFKRGLVFEKFPVVRERSVRTDTGNKNKDGETVYKYISKKLTDTETKNEFVMSIKRARSSLYPHVLGDLIMDGAQKYIEHVATWYIPDVEIMNSQQVDKGFVLDGINSLSGVMNAAKDTTKMPWHIDAQRQANVIFNEAA